MRSLIPATLFLALVGCKNVAPDADTWAIIVEPDEMSRTALQSAVNEMFDTEVLLADDALTDTSLLIIERKIPRSIEGSPAQGRNMEMPFQLRLVTDGKDCILVDPRDGSRHILADTRCAAEDQG